MVELHYDKVRSDIEYINRLLFLKNKLLWSIIQNNNWLLTIVTVLTASCSFFKENVTREIESVRRGRWDSSKRLSSRPQRRRHLTLIITIPTASCFIFEGSKIWNNWRKWNHWRWVQLFRSQISGSYSKTLCQENFILIEPDNFVQRHLLDVLRRGREEIDWLKNKVRDSNTLCQHLKERIRKNP